MNYVHGEEACSLDFLNWVCWVYDACCYQQLYTAKLHELQKSQGVGGGGGGGGGGGVGGLPSGLLVNFSIKMSAVLHVPSLVKRERYNNVQVNDMYLSCHLRFAIYNIFMHLRKTHTCMVQNERVCMLKKLFLGNDGPS